jgi:hypothetical protein
VILEFSFLFYLSIYRDEIITTPIVHMLVLPKKYPDSLEAGSPRHLPALDCPKSWSTRPGQVPKLPGYI